MNIHKPLLAPVFSLLLMAGCATTQETPDTQPRRLVYVPHSTPGSPLEASEGAVWGSLRPFPKANSPRLTMMAWVDLGDKFPVKMEGDDTTLFEVALAEGDDDRLLIEITSAEPPDTVELIRDEPVTRRIAGADYRFNYPSVSVAADDERHTTTKATLTITTNRN